MLHFKKPIPSLRMGFFVAINLQLLIL